MFSIFLLLMVNCKKIIFLISQPRAGSSLTQRILGSHKHIYTRSESWVMLHPLHALKPLNITSTFNSDIYSIALNDFIDKLPGGQDLYYKVIGQAYLDLYNAILAKEQKKYFLDKTPRYYLIINELYKCFPNAKFIFLWRNPAAVIYSIINTWTKTNYHQLAEFKHDLIDSIPLMLEGMNLLGDNAISLKYEDLINEPFCSIELLCNFIGIKFDKSIINYGSLPKEKWKYGDKGVVLEKNRPDPKHQEKWKDGLSNIQIYRIIDEYISELGSETLSKIGYSIDEINNILDKHRPIQSKYANTNSLHTLLNKKYDIEFEFL